MASTSSSGHAECAHNSKVSDSGHSLESKHKVFLSHSGVQKDFVEQLCVDLERCDRFPFFDKLRSSLPIGEKFPKLLFDAIEQCRLGVIILSEEFFMRSKWPMLEVNAMVKEHEKPNSSIKIIPILYLITMKALKDPRNHKRWISQWKKWAIKDKRVNVEEWKRALRVLEAINSIVMKEGIGDVKFREEIVAEICRLVPLETQWDDSHIQGCARLCKVIQDKMNQVVRVSKICTIGLYGMGGIGKTTICKALCNKLSSNFHDKVCHIEFGSGSQMELLEKTLKKFTKIRHDTLHELDDINQGFSYLKNNMPRQQVFLVVDNVQDNYKSIAAAQRYLKLRYGQGSVVLVTARSFDILKKLSLDETNSLEMPELEETEARSLFLNYTILPYNDKVHEGFIKNSIKRCYFLKGDGKNGHYHPLALKVLGQQLGSNSTLWATQLHKIDVFNQFGDLEHPIFSILRNSFDSLEPKHKFVFIDLALLLSTYDNWPIQWTHLDWLCMVYEESIEDMKKTLEILKAKSLLEDLDGGFTGIGMHDLWREFAVLETKAQDFRDQRWVYQVDGRRAAVGRSGLWRENVERMCFLNLGWKALDGLKLDDFVNLTAFTLRIPIFMADCVLDLDFSGLKHLKSLEVMTTPGLRVRAHGLSSLTSLVDLLLYMPGISPCLDGIGCLTNLQYLKITDCKGIEALDLTELEFLRVVKIIDFPDLMTIRGFSSRLANLRLLSIEVCESLRECPGLDELYSMEVLSLWECGMLQRLPCLGQLTNLKELVISGCKSLRAVPGLSDLVALEELEAVGCWELATLPDLVKLAKLQVLEISGCPMQRMPRLDSLIALTTFRASLSEVSGDLPSFSNLPALKHITIDGWNGPIWTSIQNLSTLEELQLLYCKGDDVVPDHVQNLKKLKRVELIYGEHKDLLGLSNVTALEALEIAGCSKLERLPEFERLTKLRHLRIRGLCYDLGGWPSTSDLRLLEELEVDGLSLMKIGPDHDSFTGLRRLTLWGSECEDVLSIASLSQLESLKIWYFATTEALDFRNYPQLKELWLGLCFALKWVTCSIPLTALNALRVEDCYSLVEMPDLCTFPHLEEIRLENCRALKRLSCSRPLTAMNKIELIGCDHQLEMPDLSMFPKLEEFTVRGDPYRYTMSTKGRWQ